MYEKVLLLKFYWLIDRKIREGTILSTYSQVRYKVGNTIYTPSFFKIKYDFQYTQHIQKGTIELLKNPYLSPLSKAQLDTELK